MLFFSFCLSHRALQKGSKETRLVILTADQVAEAQKRLQCPAHGTDGLGKLKTKAGASGESDTNFLPRVSLVGVS